MAELANCKFCGDVFVKTHRDICVNCYKEVEADFKRVNSFLKKRTNRSATMSEIASETDVDEERIMRFIKEKRLHVIDMPQLTYPCERCGHPIQDGNLCINCQKEMKADLAHHDETERLAGLAQNKKGHVTYHAYNKNKN